MSNLEKLVPPLELCKLIPDGEFADSAFIWVNAMDNTPKVICRPWDKKSTAAPAPTLQEILEAIGGIKEISYPDELNPGRTLTSDPQYKPSIEFFPGNNLSWRSARWTDSIWSESDATAPEAAIRTYLKVKGVTVTMPCVECGTWLQHLGDDQYQEECFDTIKVRVKEICPKCGYKYYDGFLLHLYKDIDKHLIWVNTPMGSRWIKKQSDPSETSDLSNPA